MTSATRLGWSRGLAAGLAAPLVAALFGGALVAQLPLAERDAFAVGVHAMLPLWVVLACTLPLSRSGARAWAYCGVLAVLSAVALLL